MAEVSVITLGCRLNAFEAEAMRRLAGKAGLAREVVIVNSCAVTNEAVRQTRQAIRRARRTHPAATVVVTGCAAQLDPGGFAAMPEVDHVLGNAEKLQPESFQALAADSLPRVKVADIFAVRETAPHLIDGFADRVRAFVEIQTGCDHRCTFCIIPFARGASRSVPMGAVVDQIRQLVARGIREVVLTGVDLTSYGGDLPGRPRLAHLVRAILEHVPELDRLRLSSLDPAEIDDDLIRLFAEEERLMPHVHLSLQAGDDLILKRMKRRHLGDDVRRLVADLRAARSGILFGADVITGFPTETEAQFANTCRLVEECEIAFLHVFPYSARQGTPAARMPQLPVRLRKERARRLRLIGARVREAALRPLIGRPLRVLVERRENGAALGHSEEFASVIIPDAEGNARTAVGAVVTVLADALEEGHLIARDVIRPHPFPQHEVRAS